MTGSGNAGDAAEADSSTGADQVPTGGDAAVPELLERRTERVLDELFADWGGAALVDPFEYGPKPWYPDECPDSVTGQLEQFAGIASVVVFWTAAHEETVLVYHRGGNWEPPGGAVEGDDSLEETALKEAAEETGLDVELTDLLYAGTVRYRYEDGTTIPLPVASFVGHRVGGELQVERAVTDHPGVTRGVGLFGPDVLPEDCRDRDWIRSLLAE